MCKKPRGRPLGPFCRAGTEQVLDLKLWWSRIFFQSIWSQHRAGHQHSNQQSNWLRGNVQHACVHNVLFASWWRYHGDRMHWTSPGDRSPWCLMCESQMCKVWIKSQLNNDLHTISTSIYRNVSAYFYLH